MGTSVYSYDTDFANLINKQYAVNNADTLQCVIDYAYVDLKVVYVAVSTTNKHTGKTIVQPDVLLVRFYGGKRDKEVGIKGVGLDSYYKKCPLRILDKLSPSNDPAVAKWISDCRMHHLLKGGQIKLSIGTIFKTPKPVRFSNGYIGQVFCVGGKGSYRALAPHKFQCKLNRLDRSNLEQLVAQDEIPTWYTSDCRVSETFVYVKKAKAIAYQDIFIVSNDTGDFAVLTIDPRIQRPSIEVTTESAPHITTQATIGQLSLFA